MAKLRTMDKTKTCLFIIISCAFIVRMSLVLTSPLPEFRDAAEYDRIAWNLVNSNGYSMDKHPPYTPTARRGPTYPLFLAGIYLLFGRNYTVVRVIQAIVSSMTCLVGYLIARDIFGKKIGLISALIMALFPPLMYYDGHILTETLFTFMLAVTVLLVVKGLEHRSTVMYSIAGMFLGMTALCRPTALLFPIGVLIMLLLIYKRKKQAILHSGVLFLTFTMILLPWTIRNYITFRTLVPIATGGGSVLYGGNYKVAEESSVIGRRIKDPKSVQGDRMLIEEALKLIVRHPFGYMKMCVERFVRFWKPRSWSDLFGIGSFSEYIRSDRYLPLIPKMMLLSIDGSAIFLGFLGGILSLPMWRRTLPIGMPILYFTAVHVAIHARSRYRVPVMPFVVIFATIGLFHIVTIIRNRQRGCMLS